MTIYQGDARDLSMIEDGTVACAVTSPPYPRVKVYGNDDREIGLGSTVNSYCEEMVQVASEVRKKLIPGGTYWLNIGEKSNFSGGAGGDYNPVGRFEGQRKAGRFADPNYPAGHIGITRKVEQALQDDGWRVRLSIIWDKSGRGEVGSMVHTRRPMLTHEYILMLAPDKYPTRFNERAIGSPDFDFELADGTRQPFIEPGSVWHFPPGSDMPEAKHPAPFPIELPRRCILLSTKPGDLVLDPFAGSGTAGRAAEMLGRRFVGVDLYAATT